jgi:hypothetical protein
MSPTCPLDVTQMSPGCPLKIQCEPDFAEYVPSGDMTQSALNSGKTDTQQIERHGPR